MTTVPYSSGRVPALGDLNNVQINLGTLANNDTIKYSTATNTFVNGVSVNFLQEVLTAGNSTDLTANFADPLNPSHINTISHTGLYLL